MNPQDKEEVAAAIRRVLDGDVGSYEVIYNLTDRPLRAFIGSRYGYYGPEFVDEVAILTHEYTRTRLNKSFQTWLNWQSRNVARKVRTDWFGPRFVRFDENVHSPWATPVCGPAEAYEATERSRVIRQVCEDLNEDSRLSVKLHDMEGKTLAESAEEAGLSEGQLRRKRARALAVLKRRLQEQGINATERDSTPAPIWYGWDDTGYDDDWTAGVTADLPDGPDEPLAAEEEKEVPDV